MVFLISEGQIPRSLLRKMS